MNSTGNLLDRGRFFLHTLGALALATGCAGNVGDAGDAEDTASTSEAILGGSNAVPGGHPWIVRLFNNSNPNNGTGECAGTLITADWVVTAAHCVTKDPAVGPTGPHGEAQPWEIFMYLGDYDTSGFGAPSEGGNYEQGKFAGEVHIQPSYAGSNHDIALVKLETSAFINSRVKPIAVSHATTAINSGTGIAAGWGATAQQNPVDPNTFSSDILQRASLPIRSVATCDGSEVGLIRHLAADEMCAGTAGGAGTCHGDSGGPLIRQVNSTYELIGVTSWGTLYCGGYSVFSRVSSHLSWIRTYVPGA
jgi:secreted trypsin-like serine protease